MIIGISGKIGSGKDTVALMIQYLTLGLDDREVLEAVDVGKPNKMPIWEIKRFADKLKDTVCLWLGCSREQLEDREFKEKPLGEEWHVHYAETRNRPRKIFRSRSELMKYMTHLEENHYQDYEDTHVGDYRLTPRKLMQLLGTEAGREIIHPNIWVNALFADYEKVFNMQYYNERAHNSNSDTKYITTLDEMVYPKWIIPDTRFPNEANAIKDRDGVLIRVHRNIDKRFPKLWTEFGYDGNRAMLRNDFYVFLKKHHPEMHEKLTHDSETGLDAYGEWDYTISNNGTLETLLDVTKNIMEEVKQ